MQKTFAIYWDETIYEHRQVAPPATGTYAVAVGKKRMRAIVEVNVDLERIANLMGRKAAESKGGKCVDGHVIVKRVTNPEQVS